jgi:phosphotransferase system enzyme I (PtsI)
MASRTLTGIPASPGLGVAKALVLPRPEAGDLRRLEPREIDAELARLRGAVARARQDLAHALVELAELGEQEARDLVEIESMVLEDPASLEALEARVREERLTAEAAIQAVVAPFTMRYAGHTHERFRDRAGDVASAFRAVLHQLQRRELPRFETLREPVIVVAEDLAPHEAIRFEGHRARIAGIATESGGRTSHSAILARTFGIPCVVGVPGLTEAVVTGEWIAVDGYSGTVEIDLTARGLARRRRRQAQLAAGRERLEGLRDLPCETTDGRRVELSANIELPAEVDHVLVSGAQGIGLYRTEFFYLDRPHLPSEGEQREAYELVARRLHPNTVIVRTMDLGGDKVASYLGATAEANPYLGWRGIRFALHHPALFRTQLRAIYRAGTLGNLKMMFPMITTYAELDEALELCAEVRDELAREGVPHDPDLEIGMMVETPSAVFSADLMAPRVKFFSIGSNDLIQYTLAMDRGNERIAHLYEPLEPAVLRAIAHTVRAGHGSGIWVGVCGEMAGDPRIAVLLVGLEVDELSVSPFDAPRVKAAVRAVTYEGARRIAAECLRLPSAKAIRAYLGRELDPLLPAFLLGSPDAGEEERGGETESGEDAEEESPR